jgi:hypothetical protein
VVLSFLFSAAIARVALKVVGQWVAVKEMGFKRALEVDSCGGDPSRSVQYGEFASYIVVSEYDSSPVHKMFWSEGT